MSYQKRVSFSGIAYDVLYGVPFDPQLCFWVAQVDNRQIFYVRFLEYGSIEDQEFIGDMSKLSTFYWFDGTCEGFSVSHDNTFFRFVLIENNQLTVKTMDDYSYEMFSSVTIKSEVGATNPVIFYKETDDTQNLIIVTKNNGNFDCYRTDDWVTFKRTNLLDMSARWNQYLLSTTTDVTLEEYLTMDEKVLDIYNSL